MTVRLNEAPTAGPIEPAPDGVDAPYWHGLAEGELRIQQCRSCGRHVWTPQHMCRWCGGTDLVWRPIAAVGTVYSWTRTHHAFTPELEAAVPYVVVLVELDEAPEVRLLGMLVDDDIGPRIGDRVQGVIQTASDLTSGLYLLRWRLA